MSAVETIGAALGSLGLGWVFLFIKNKWPVQFHFGSEFTEGANGITVRDFSFEISWLNKQGEKDEIVEYHTYFVRKVTPKN